MRKDFEKYFTKLQLDYNNINKQKEKIDEEYGKGLLNDIQYSNFMQYYSAIKVNYDRMHYARYLLHKYPDFIEKIFEKFTARDIQKTLKMFKDQKADEESVLDENKDALKNVEEENYK